MSDKAYVDAKITAMIEHFKTHQISFSWSVGPATHPANLVQRLEEHHFTHVHTSAAMAMDIQVVPANIEQPAGLAIQEVEDGEMMKTKVAIEKAGFDASEQEAQNYYNGYLASGFGKRAHWHHYIGQLRNEPVVVASLLLQAGVAGIYGVATLEASRRKGIGTAMMQHVLRKAGAAGYRIAILSATEMSEKLYRRLGFQDYCTINHFRWYPNEESEDNA
jgi:GNAT superfamily N-acetyltransferase